ncbi:MAG: hypothetical protein WBK71_04325 [Acetomicrobium sp.]
MSGKKSSPVLLGFALLGMLIAPPLLLYPAVIKENVALEVIGYPVLVISMLIPIFKG